MAGRCVDSAAIVATRRTVLAAALAGLTFPARAHGTTLVVAQGDSLTYGQDTASPQGTPPINNGFQRRSVRPYPEYLGKLLGPGFRVVNQGYPGDRTVEGLARWGILPGVDIAILMFGTNDALNYGGHPEGTVAPDAYHRNLDRLAARQADAGARLVVIAPPPVADPVQDQRLAPYRRAAQQVAHARSAAFVLVPRMKGLWVDGVHFSPAGNTWLAAHLARLIPSLVR